jgi:hypothetical protein
MRPDQTRLNPFQLQPSRWALEATQDGRRRFVEGRFE